MSLDLNGHVHRFLIQKLHLLPIAISTFNDYGIHNRLDDSFQARFLFVLPAWNIGQNGPQGFLRRENVHLKHNALTARVDISFAVHQETVAEFDCNILHTSDS